MNETHRRGVSNLRSDALDLRGWRIDSLDIVGMEECNINISMISPGYNICSKKLGCALAGSPYKFGSRTRKIQDLPMHGKFVTLTYTAQRYRCRNCKAVSYAVVKGISEDNSDLGPDIHNYHRMTQRLYKYICQQSAKRTFVDIARQIGISDVTIGNIFRKTSTTPAIEQPPTAPRVLGVDEVYINGVCYTVFCNIEQEYVIDIFEGQNDEVYRSFIKSLGEGRHLIEYVCQDMSGNYRVQTELYLPNAVIIIDRYHVVKKLNEAMTKVYNAVKDVVPKEERSEFRKHRKGFFKKKPSSSLRWRLKKWLDRYDDLNSIYHSKQRLFKLYSFKSRARAEKFYDDWHSTITDTVRKYLSDTIHIMKMEFRPYIFNYFDAPYTNAFTESMNSRIKSFMSRGNRYKFETLRLKMLQAYGVGNSLDNRNKPRKTIPIRPQFGPKQRRLSLNDRPTKLPEPRRRNHSESASCTNFSMPLRDAFLNQHAATARNGPI